MRALLVAAAIVVGPQVVKSITNDISPLSTPVTVTRVLGGDTITVTDATGEKLGDVRVLGIDAPEVARGGSARRYGASCVWRSIKAHEPMTVVLGLRPPGRDSGAPLHGCSARVRRRRADQQIPPRPGFVLGRRR